MYGLRSPFAPTKKQMKGAFKEAEKLLGQLRVAYPERCPLVGVSAASAKLIVSARTRAQERQLKKRFDGLPIEVEYIGKVRPATA